MASITVADLVEIGLTTDEIAGFEAQVASGKSCRQVLWPEHYQGIRVDRFCNGAEIARRWLIMRRAYASARRSKRAADFKVRGATETLRPEGEELRAEQVECLRVAAGVSA